MMYKYSVVNVCLSLFITSILKKDESNIDTIYTASKNFEIRKKNEKSVPTSDLEPWTSYSQIHHSVHKPEVVLKAVRIKALRMHHG